MRQRIRLTEGDLRRIVKESVNRVLNEMDEATNGWTEANWDSLQPSFFDSGNRKIRKQRARNYLQDRFARENNLSPEQIKQLGINLPNGEDAPDVPTNVLRRAEMNPRTDPGTTSALARGYYQAHRQ